MGMSAGTELMLSSDGSPNGSSGGTALAGASLAHARAPGWRRGVVGAKSNDETATQATSIIKSRGGGEMG
jgi:hypothetical protein